MNHSYSSGFWDSIPKDKIANPGDLGIRSFSICAINSNTLFQRMRIRGQSHSMWYNVPIEPHFLQQSGEAWVSNLDILNGVRYQRSSIFCVNSQRLILLLAEYVVWSAFCHVLGCRKRLVPAPRH